MHFDESLRALVELAASRHNAFTSDEAAEHSIQPKRLRRGELAGELIRLHPKVWAFTALTDGPHQALLGSVLSLPGTAATTTSAAWLHGWLEQPPSIPQLWFPEAKGRNHPVADLRRWSRIEPPRDITSVDGIPTLNKAATLCWLGAVVDTKTLERCLDEYLRTESVRWLDETMERLGNRKPGGVRALAELRNSPSRVQGVTDSWLERVVANLVALPFLPPIELQHQVSVVGANYRLDIACPELMLGVEAHSRSFHWGADKSDADNVRDLRLSAAGWQLLYVTYSQTRNPDEFAVLFASAARKRAEQLGVAIQEAG